MKQAKTYGLQVAMNGSILRELLHLRFVQDPRPSTGLRDTNSERQKREEGKDKERNEERAVEKK